jgi:hypothetical protein
MYFFHTLYTEIPTCFDFIHFDPTNKYTEECHLPTMMLSSLGFNNIISYDIGSLERWNISSNKQTFRIKMLHFDVKCRDGNTHLIHFVLDCLKKGRRSWLVVCHL